MGKRLPRGPGFPHGLSTPSRYKPLSPTLASRAQRRRSILLGEEDCQDTIGLRRIIRIGRVELVVEIVQVDLPEDLLAAMIEAAEVVLAVRIVVRIELVEGTHARSDRGPHVRRQ